jgi:patatin-like phospholipase/acyl hydrolase
MSHQEIAIFPKLAGVRILSLDGGGVRGIVELETLRRLEWHIGLDLPIGNFFDLIVGTSAGKTILTPLTSS